MEIYSGQAVRVTAHKLTQPLSQQPNQHQDQYQIAELCFDLKSESVNKLNQATLNEMREAVDAIAKTSGLSGLLLTSAKNVFIVGADLMELPKIVSGPLETYRAFMESAHRTLAKIEDMPFPVIALINGYALGGGFEVALTAHYRILAESAKVGLPEIKLGIYPGWGGTIRLPRVIGIDNAIEWIAAGSEHSSGAALKVGAVDAVVAPEKLREAGLSLLKECLSGARDWKSRAERKKSPIRLKTATEAVMAFEVAKGFVAQQAGPHYPAPVEVIERMQKTASLVRDEAAPIEIEGFIKVSQTPVAANLISIFLSDQYVKKRTKSVSKGAEAVKSAAVLGAGIMGGGIAYQSAYKKIPIVMKDIRPEALELGMNEAIQLLEKQVSKGAMDMKTMAKTVASIKPTLSYAEMGGVDIIVEAVVENEKVKKAVFKDLEGQIRESAIIASNTSTISITKLSEGLKRPENFCGMHFFNPVNRMPLVEVIRGKASSERAIATTVGYAAAIGKTPIVVNDCPGFLVNRILFPYLFSFVRLVKDGADPQKIDKVMEKFGWPMGPAYLSDVVGLDTAVHAGKIMAEGFPERMQFEKGNILELMTESQRLGQKNSKGFYDYAPDKKGRPKKSASEASQALVTKYQTGGAKNFEDSEVIDRLMIPLVNESVLCLQEKIVDSPMELDLALVYGIGFPPFRGGAIRYLEQMGLKAFLEKCERYSSLGASYRPAESILANAKSGKLFYPSLSQV